MLNSIIQHQQTSFTGNTHRIIDLVIQCKLIDGFQTILNYCKQMDHFQAIAVKQCEKMDGFQTFLQQ